MKLIGIYTNQKKDKGCKYTDKLAQRLSELGADVVVPDDIFSVTNYRDSSIRVGDILEGVDAVISLGGDGTFLKLARMSYRKGIPLLGINLGRLGFLTDIEKRDIDSAAESIMTGKYTLEKRMMLDMVIIREGKVLARDTALNDVVISRGALSRIIHVKTYINDTFVDVFPGDGLIVSSPTGSTAYSLSAGGPIVEPDTDMIIVTPICPHILYTRSFIADSGRVIRTVVEEDYKHEAMVTVDGQKGYEIHGGDTIITKMSSYRIKLIKCTAMNFFDILRNKIYYRGDELR